MASCTIKSQTHSSCHMYRKMDKGTKYAGIPISPFCFIVVKMKHTYKKGLMENYSIYRGSGLCATVSCINLLELSLPRSPQFLRHHCFEWEGKQGSQDVLQVNLHPGIVWQVQWRNSEVHQDPWQHEEKSPGRKYFKKSDKQVKQLHLLQTGQCCPRPHMQRALLFPGWFFKWVFWADSLICNSLSFFFACHHWSHKGGLWPFGQKPWTYHQKLTNTQSRSLWNFKLNW